MRRRDFLLTAVALSIGPRTFSEAHECQHDWHIEVVASRRESGTWHVTRRIQCRLCGAHWEESLCPEVHARMGIDDESQSSCTDVYNSLVESYKEDGVRVPRSLVPLQGRI